jgi:hypothetical protein
LAVDAASADWDSRTVPVPDVDDQSARFDRHIRADSAVVHVPTTVQRELVRTFVQLADTLADDFDLIEFLLVLARRCVDLLEVAAAGVLLADADGAVKLVVSSGTDARLATLFPKAHRDGPCFECCRNGHRLINIDEVIAARWPSFAERSRAMGFPVLHALPMRRHGERVGVLALAGERGHRLAERDAVLGQAMADTATIGILSHRAVDNGERRASQLQTALDSRVLIEQAKGVLAERRRIGLDAAFELMRSNARRNRRPLGEIAAAVVRGRGGLPG